MASSKAAPAEGYSPNEQQVPEAGGAHSKPEARAAENWTHFTAKDLSRHWYSLWCRWSPTGAPVMAFHAERIFKPDNQGGAVHNNVYHYEDERGSVSEGPLCGPWHIDASCSTPDGVVHPSRPSMVTWNLPGGDCCWATKQNAFDGDKPFAAACELFLHHDDHVRMSVGIVYSDGELKTLALIREDARGPWPSQYWSSSREASPIDHKEVQQMFKSRGLLPDMTGCGQAVFAGLARLPLENVPLSQTRWAAAGVEDAILLCSDQRVAIVAPATYRGAVSCAAAWWPTDQVMYTIEIEWDECGALTTLRRLAFPLTVRSETQ